MENSGAQDITDVSQVPYVVTGGLGAGGYACVMRVEHRESREPFAMKVHSKAALRKSKDRQRLARELRIMIDMPACPFLLHCHAAFETETDVFFVLDLIEGGDLFYHLATHMQGGDGRIWGIPEVQARGILSEVVVALQHFHKHGMIHRDVKVENIMLDARGHVKLVDYGLACELAEEGGGSPTQPMSPMGSLIYMPPELLSEKVGGRCTDWWAVGILAFELMTGRSPWSSLTDKKKVRKEIREVKVRPPRRLSSEAGELITALLEHDTNARLGSRDDSDLERAAFFRNVDWDATRRQEIPPALVPGAESTFERDRLGASRLYNTEPGPVAEVWYMGLQRISEKPPVAEENAMEFSRKTGV